MRIVTIPIYGTNLNKETENGASESVLSGYRHSPNVLSVLHRKAISSSPSLSV